METEHLIAKLREGGLKVTPQRLTICKLILSSGEHPTAEQIYEKVKKMYPTISMSTVYQTLHLLSQIGLLQMLRFNDGAARFEPDTSPHVNVICRKCGKIEDYRSESVEKLMTQISKELGLKPIGQLIEIYAYCDKCAKTHPTAKSNFH